MIAIFLKILCREAKNPVLATIFATKCRERRLAQPDNPGSIRTFTRTFTRTFCPGSPKLHEFLYQVVQ